MASTPSLENTKIHIVDGSVERVSENLRIVLTPSHAASSIQSFAEKHEMGIWIYESQDTELSDDPDNPTRFVCKMDMLLPQGDTIPVLEAQSEVELPPALYIKSVSIAGFFLKDKEIVGYDETTLIYPEINLTQKLIGQYKLFLS